MNDDLRFYLGILKRRFLPFLAVSAAVAALATVIIFAIPPLYRSEATILSESAIVSDEDVRGLNADLGAQADSLKQKLLSRDNVLAIAEKHQLFPDSRDKMSSSALVKLMRERVTFEPKALNAVRRNDDKGPVAFTLGFDYENPDLASRVANELVTLFLAANQDKQVTEATESVRFFQDESVRISQLLTRVETEITTFNQENKDTLPDRVILLNSQLERMESTRKEIQKEINKLREDLRFVDVERKLREAQYGIGGGANATTLESERQKLLIERADKRATLTPDHPDLVNLERRVSAIDKQIEERQKAAAKAGDEENTKQVEERRSAEAEIAEQKKASIGRMIEVNQQQLEETDKAIVELIKKLSLAPDVQIRLAELNRQKAGLQKQLDDVGIKLNEAQLRKQLVESRGSERFEVVDQPVTPQEPVWPKVPRLLAMGFGLAGLSGATVVGLLELINRSVRTGSDILRAVNRHPMVVIPYIMTKEENRRRTRKILMAIAGLILALALLVLAVHFFFMELDVLYYKLLNRAGV